MKTRIKETEYGNGIKIYQVQKKYECKDFFRELHRSFEYNPILTVLFSLIILIIFFVIVLFWDNEGDHFNIEDAKKEIDEYYKELNSQKKEKEKEKLAKKVVNKTYIKYP